MKKIDYEKDMKYIAKTYKEVLKDIENENRPLMKSYKLDRDYEFIRYVDYILSLMPFELERIIRKDFLETREVKWWQEFHSKSTYYRRKREAIETFVDCLSS